MGQFCAAFSKSIEGGYVSYIAETNQYLLSKEPILDDLLITGKTLTSDCTMASVQGIPLKGEIKTSGRWRNSYKIGDIIVTIDFQDQKLQDVFGGPLAHLTLTTGHPPDLNYRFTISDKTIHLFKNNKLIIQEAVGRYHYLQAFFASEIISAYSGVDNTDWLASFHGSAIQTNGQTWLILGDSGSGKSSLAAMCNASGFQCIADDLVLMHQSDALIYPNPAGISVKEGAWRVLKDFYPDLDEIPIYSSVKKKKLVKYIPINLSDQFRKPQPCHQLVWVNYRPQSAFKTQSLTHYQALQQLIPDTWVTPNKKGAQQFLDWFVCSQCWSLSYSDYREVLSWFKNIKI